MKVIVVWFNSAGCSLSETPFDTMTEATAHVIDMCRTGALEPGDKIEFKEVL